MLLLPKKLIAELEAEKKDLPRVEIEPAFDECVKGFGGELGRELFPKSPNFENADYIFREANVIAELKCLQKNFLDDADFQRKIDRLFKIWLDKGLVKDFSRRKVNLATFPESCQRDVHKILKKPLQQVIEKANAQIKATKIKMNMPNAVGLLLIANDGNYQLEAFAAMPFITQIIRNMFSCINYVVYFTENMPARSRISDANISLWITAWGEKENESKLPKDFVDRLGDAWIEKSDSMKGVKHTVITMPKSVLENITLKQPIKKENVKK